MLWRSSDMMGRKLAGLRRVPRGWIAALFFTAGFGAMNMPLAARMTAQARPDPKTKVPITVAASSDVNPDAAGKAAPIVLRVYQLKGDASFSRADFRLLFDDDQKALGSELVVRDEYVLEPSETRTVYVTIDEQARVIGAVALFRDVRSSVWRATLPAPIRGLTVSVERARLVLYPD